jgi:AcrR family transcriptional regulator
LRGYNATTTDQIAVAAGLTPQEFARYVTTKNAIVMSLVEDCVRAGVARWPALHRTRTRSTRC